MSLYTVVLCYVSALAGAVALLWYAGVKHWYWHVLSFIAAFAVGLCPMPEAWSGPGPTLFVGWLFTILFMWGLLGTVLALSHYHLHSGHQAS